MALKLMRECAKGLGPTWERVDDESAETKNELRECENGAQIGAFSLTDFYSWPISEAIRQLAYLWEEAVFNTSVLKEHVSHAPPLRTILLPLDIGTSKDLQ